MFLLLSGFALLELWPLAWVFSWSIIGMIVLGPIFATLFYRMFRLPPEKRFRKTIGQQCAGALINLAAFVFCGATLIISSAKMSQTEMPKISSRLGGTTDFPYAPLEPGDLVDYRGEVHVHSPLSHDARVRWDEIFAAAKQNKISWLIFTDHISDLPPGEFPTSRDDVVLIYGNERSWDDHGSHFLIPINGETKIHAYGHIEELKEWSDEHWDAIEIVNFHANAYNFHAGFRHNLRTLGTILGRALFNPKSVYEALTEVIPENLERWQKLSEKEGRPIPIFAGPDAHQNIRFFGQQLDPYPFMLSLVSTHIWVEAGKELNQASVLGALKSGRSYVCFDYLGDPTGFQFSAQGNHGHVLGGGVVEETAFLWVSHVTPGRIPAKDSEIRLFCNNHLEMIDQIDANAFVLNFRKPKPGFWRVEIWRQGRPWIISGQIFVK